jgi:hypothetical protein
MHAIRQQQFRVKSRQLWSRLRATRSAEREQRHLKLGPKEDDAWPTRSSPRFTTRAIRVMLRPHGASSTFSNSWCNVRRLPPMARTGGQWRAWRQRMNGFGRYSTPKSRKGEARRQVSIMDQHSVAPSRRNAVRHPIRCLLVPAGSQAAESGKTWRTSWLRPSR